MTAVLGAHPPFGCAPSVPARSRLLVSRAAPARTVHPRLKPFALFHLETAAAPRETPPAMPLHFYAPARPPCKLCGGGFEHRAAPGDPLLTACPTCGEPIVRQVAQPVNTPKLSAPVSVSRARQAGFTLLRRTSDGCFEKQ